MASEDEEAVEEKVTVATNSRADLLVQSYSSISMESWGTLAMSETYLMNAA